MNVKIHPLHPNDREQFMYDLQTAFQAGVEAEFGKSDDVVIPRGDIESALGAEGAQAFVAVVDDEIVGGCVVSIHPDTHRNSLDLLYVRTDCHSQGIGLKIWQEMECMFPETTVWETCTPYFDKRNIHFYVNKCGFQITDFYCKGHPDPNCPEDYTGHPGHIDEMFHFEKVMR